MLESVQGQTAFAISFGFLSKLCEQLISDGPAVQLIIGALEWVIMV